MQLPSENIINNPAHHAVFSCLIKNEAPPTAGQPITLRLYLDSGGDIYPEAQFLPASTGAIRYPGGQPNTEADLQWYYDREANQPMRDKLFAHYGVAKPQDTRAGYDTLAWDKLRHAMARQLAANIDAATANGKKTLVVLVHGYNVADYEHALVLPCGPAKPNYRRPQPYYTVIRKKLLDRRSELNKAVWLEVYWDGFQNNPLRIWGAAQASARYAGLGLREVLGQTDAATPIRAFTHSAGGLVLVQALWNNDAFDIENGDRYEPQLRSMMRNIPTPAHADVRAGMIVPALTEGAFKFYYERTPAIRRSAYRLVIGQNRKDFPINKGPLGCHKFGDTCMGADKGSFQQAEQQVAAGGQHLQRVDFCVTPTNGIAPKSVRQALAFEKHDWRLYFDRVPVGARATAEPLMTAFLHKVLD